ncbi:MAG: hypothetical protein ACREPY_12990 [Rhodanobacteraceae bacterium]
MQALEARMRELHTLLGHTPESPLPDAVYRVAGAYTDAVSALLDVVPEWLQAWWLEHDFGTRAMQAGLNGEPLRELATLDALLDLIVDDNKAGR